MIEHSVWIKFHDHVEPARRQQHLDALAALKDRVPNIVELAIGENFTDRANGYTHGLLVRLPTRDDLARYATHPRHVSVATALKKDADLLAMDFEHD